MPAKKKNEELAIPHSAVELEAELIGAILSASINFETISEWLKPEDFYNDANQKIMRCIFDMQNMGYGVDIMTLCEELRKRGELDAVGGAFYLTTTTNRYTGPTMIEKHSIIVLQMSMLRKLQELSGEVHFKSNQKDADPFVLLEELEDRTFLIANMIYHTSVSDMPTAVMEVLKRIELIRNNPGTLTGVPSGFILDRITNGWQPGNLIILAARPSVGKTAFALNLARNAAASQIKETPVLLFSLEMSKIQLMSRLLSNESGVLLNNLNSGNLTEDEVKALHLKGGALLSSYKIYIDDKAGMTLNELRSKSKRMVSKFGVGLIIIDYLQLVDSGLNPKTIREQQIAHISRSLKKLAKELNVPIIAISQLSRSVEERADKEPKLSDLRESGAIEQDADIVVFLYRPSKEDIQRDPALANKGMVKIAKNRDGSLYDGVFNFYGETQTWNDKDDNVFYKPINNSSPF